MSKTMKRLFGIAVLTMVSLVVSAQEAQDEQTVQDEQTAQVKVDLSEPFTGGTVVPSIGTPSEEDGSVVVTLTVTPADDYYISKADLVVVATRPLTRAEGDEEGQPVIAGTLALEGDDPADLTLERVYSVTLEAGLGAWVQEANFHVMTTLVLDADVTEIEDGSLSIASSITIGNAKEVVALGDNDVTGKTVTVPGNLYNAYLSAAGWSDAHIVSPEAIRMEGVKFVEDKNEYDVYVSADQDLMVPYGVTALDITGIQGNAVLVDEVQTITKGKAVLLYGGKVKTDDLRTAAAPVAPAIERTRAEGDEAPLVKCALKVVPDNEETQKTNGLEVSLGQVYLLYNDVFYLSQAGVIPIGGIYLELTKEEQEQMRTRSFLTIGGDDSTTGIRNLTPTLSKGEGGLYDLSGRRLSTVPTRKGIYIFGGKKVVVK